MVIIFIIGFELGPGSICWPYVAEICSNKKQRGLGTIANWFWTLVVGVSFPLLVDELPKNSVYLCFAGISLIGFFFFIFFIIETRGKSSE